MRKILLISLTIVIALLHSNANSSEESIILEDNEGYLLVRVIFNNPFYSSEIDSGILRIELTGEKSYDVKNINIGVNHYLIKLPAGDYEWEKIMVWGGRYFPLDQYKFKARVEPQKIAYSGDLIISNKGNTKAQFDYINRSVTAFKTIKINYKEYLNKYPAVYTGYGSDHLFEYLKDVGAWDFDEEQL